jgi:hypothetical protein
MGLAANTIRDYRRVGLITPVFYKPDTITLYDAHTLCDELIAKGLSDRVRDAAKTWKATLKAEKKTAGKRTPR